jgi:hypothetical protein
MGSISPVSLIITLASNLNKAEVYLNHCFHVLSEMTFAQPVEKLPYYKNTHAQVSISSMNGFLVKLPKSPGPHREKRRSEGLQQGCQRGNNHGEFGAWNAGESRREAAQEEK